MSYDNRSRGSLASDARTRTGRTDQSRIARYWMLAVGVALVAVGLLGFIDNPIVGENGIFMTGPVHNIIHIVTGLVALGIGAALHGRDLGVGAIAFGVMYAAVLLLTLVSPNLFGILDMPVNDADHGLHAVLAVGSIAFGWMAMSERSTAV